METVETICPHCGATEEVSAEHVGKTARCGSCRERFVVEAVASPPARAARRPEPAPSGRAPIAVVAAVVAAVVGAALWTVVTWKTGYEIGWIAWLLGAGVGGATMLAGGRGPVIAGMAAVLTLGSICVGKYGALRMVIANNVDAMTTEQVTAEYHAEIVADADAFATLTDSTSDDALAIFAVQRGYHPGPATDVDVDAFRTDVVPMLRFVKAERPDLDAFREHEANDFEELVLADAGPTLGLVEDLGAMDLLFLFLGVSTAWRLVNRSGDDEDDDAEHDDA